MNSRRLTGGLLLVAFACAGCERAHEPELRDVVGSELPVRASLPKGLSPEHGRFVLLDDPTLVARLYHLAMPLKGRPNFKWITLPITFEFADGRPSVDIFLWPELDISRVEGLRDVLSEANAGLPQDQRLDLDNDWWYIPRDPSYPRLEATPTKVRTLGSRWGLGEVDFVISDHVAVDAIYRAVKDEAPNSEARPNGREELTFTFADGRAEETYIVDYQKAADDPNAPKRVIVQWLTLKAEANGSKGIDPDLKALLGKP